MCIINIDHYLAEFSCFCLIFSNQGATVGGSGQVPEVKLGLQVDYWKEKDSTKYSLKTNFKSFHVTCLPNPGERSQNPALALDVVTKGKKNLSEFFFQNWRIVCIVFVIIVLFSRGF